MADAVTVQALLTGKRKAVVMLTNVSDATGEAAVVKVDRSTLTNIGGVEPETLRLTEIQFCVQGFPYVKLAFDHNTDQTIAVLSGTGKLCFKDAALRDLGAAGGTGDLVLTAPAGWATGSYTLLIELVW